MVVLFYPLLFGFSHQLVIAMFGGIAPLIDAAFVGAGHPRWVALSMIAVIAVYFTLPETGSKTPRATVALNDREVIEGRAGRGLGGRPDD